MLHTPLTRTFVAAAGLILLLACASTSPPAPASPDIVDLHPGDLLDRDLDALNREAEAAYAEGRYEDAVLAWAELVRARPTHMVALYNMACCFGLLGSDSQAAEFVAAAWGAGFRDLDQIRSDSDFDRVRGSAAWRSLMTVLEDSLAPTFEMEAPWAATIHVGLAGELVEDRLYPLVIGLHGYNATPGPFANLFAELDLEAPFVYCAPRAPYAVAGGPGFSWFGRAADGSPSPLQRRLSAEYVLAVVEAMAERYPVDRERVYLLGFSQGALLTYEIALDHPQALAGAIPVGGWLDSASRDGIRLAKARDVAFLICNSPDDRGVSFEEAAKGAAALEAAGVRTDFRSYPGGHVLSSDLAATIAAWIASDPGSTEIR